MPDHFEELFADLRVATIPQVRPPGIDAVRRTARRRRRTTRTAAAAAVALAVTGGLLVTGLPLRGGHRVAPAERVRDLADTATRALRTQVPDLAGQPLSGPVSADGEVTFPGQPAGSHRLALACAGPGKMAVEAQLVRGAGDSTALGGYIVSCATAPKAAVLTFRLPVTGSVTVVLAGDPAAVGSAGYAVAMATSDEAGRQDVPAAESAWNAARAADVLTAAGRPSPVRVTTEQVLSTTHVTGPGSAATPGDHELALVCAGPGTLTLTVQTVRTGDGKVAGSGTTVAQQQVKCRDEDPRLDATELLSLPRDFGFVITAVPDGEARNRAGWAYHLGPE
ncbi:hypothetical protein DMB66_44550 [Actinoplanes sp. ATCC 53533]|uniref:hypothetical protein n=1 Tax=Actinoplanes sp. ATCC 53533 TaxID=1288362 RepID=UPI000F76CCAD|nr:hypothetical protein [Actinoplanes sp. ATCC 53533]RSM49750.1 hypothetical protein DMB66_44550 [Actinoplanes sp. ATCC 53533]